MKHLHENDALTPDQPGRGGRRSGDNTRSPSPLAPQDGDTSAAGRISPAIPYRIKTPGQVLHDAIGLGDLDRVKRIIEASPECVDARNERGRTSLHAVSQSGRNDIVKLLISKGADINARSGWKYTPLAFAANSVRPDVVMTLLEAGADMELPSNDGCTPLHFAALKKEKKAHSSILILLIKGANSNALNKKGLTALQSAVSEGRYLNVRTLCAFGADPAFKNPDGNDAFHYAKSLDSDLGKQLSSTLSKWESPGKQTRKILPELFVFIREGGELDIGEMLFWASRHGHVSLVECILELFVEETPSIVEYENPTKGWNSLHRAAWAGQSKAVKVLLAHGATIDARTPGQQFTPLHLAADKGRQRTVKVLVDHGADILAKNRQDATAFWLAATGRHVKTLEVLLQHSLRIEDFEQHQAALDYYQRARDHLAELEAGEKSKQDVGGAATPGGGPSTRNDSITIRLDSQSPDAKPVTPVPSFVPALQKISYSIRKNVTGIEIFDDIAGGQGTVAMSRDFLYNRLQTFLNSYLHTIPEFQRDSSPKKASRKVRICVIDTGLDKTHPSVMAAVMDDRLRAEKTFKDNGGTDTNDEHGHGTHMMELILHVAPEADIYVAKIADARFIPEKDFHLIAKAIRWALLQDVDIISMSFGLDHRDHDIAAAIDEAAASRKIIIAAAGNDGNNQSRAFPSSHRDVIAIHASDGKGKDGGISPPRLDHDDNFMTLGMAVPLTWRSQDVIKSGTSFATPIAAGIAADVLEIVRRTMSLTPQQVDRLYSCECMRQIFRLLSPHSDGYRYVVPWSLWNHKKADDMIRGSILEILNS